MPPLLQFVAAPTARHLRDAAPALLTRLRRRRTVHALHRRGADLGYAVELPRQACAADAAELRWRAAEAVFLPGIARDRLSGFDAAIAASLAMFERLRGGGRFLRELETRLATCDDFEYAGSTIDRNDTREIERVHVRGLGPGGADGNDSEVWAKLAWIATDESDRSLRIRFSFGIEQTHEWLQGGEQLHAWSDRFAAAAFPECAAILGCAPLQRLLAQLLGRPFRLSERIIYNNHPGGGAVFHHDAEIGQLGVVFTQLEGATAWLAIGKRRLAALLARTGHARDRRRAMAALDAGGERLWHAMNRDAGFTAELAARGALFVLHAGDSILLPSHGIDDCAWHSVVALGDTASLAHSYGIFARAVEGGGAAG